MSVNYAYIMPLNENYVPSTEDTELILNVIEKRNIDKLKVFIEKNNSVQFYDCGENFEYVICPVCNKELAIEWWQNEMTRASKSNFSKINLITPCCDEISSLNELNYFFAQGFAKFVIKIEGYQPDKLVIDDNLFFQLRNISNERWKLVFSRY